MILPIRTYATIGASVDDKLLLNSFVEIYNSHSSATNTRRDALSVYALKWRGHQTLMLFYGTLHHLEPSFPRSQSEDS